ncbi:hypothetical protein EJD97_002960 [Solanum chilense]|uniref:Uncharacterized protein n=1 Tax=Solanum chilense TaxID=4083 RepID=A0A6N2C3H6_SOLCI|nr:hypothetical protein EJD97_002960 [Solanum chilense]
MLVTVRRWQRSAAAEGRWGSLTKFWVTKLVMVRRVYDGEGNEEEQQKKLHKYGATESMTVRRDHDDPSRGPSTQPCFGRFPANGVLV